MGYIAHISHLFELLELLLENSSALLRLFPSLLRLLDKLTLRGKRYHPTHPPTQWKSQKKTHGSKRQQEMIITPQHCLIRAHSISRLQSAKRCTGKTKTSVRPPVLLSDSPTHTERYVTLTPGIYEKTAHNKARGSSIPACFSRPFSTSSPHP